ncbi:MAG TPA: hypothetical protein PKD89_02660 [Candidatus Microthrix sp.]|nr:hypothetical protein [uncultured Candidatus Microthrix sp.]HMS46460.1 hypothetical protein [Candidatus Microthrix sp.]
MYVVGFCADSEICNAVIDYGPDGLNVAGAATVSLRSAMNLRVALGELSADTTPASVIDWFRATVDQPNFDGHPYICDGEQVPDLPTLCSPQQVLVELVGPGEFAEVSDGWIDAAELLNER